MVHIPELLVNVTEQSHTTSRDKAGQKDRTIGLQRKKEEMDLQEIYARQVM